MWLRGLAPRGWQAWRGHLLTDPRMWVQVVRDGRGRDVQEGTGVTHGNAASP